MRRKWYLLLAAAFLFASCSSQKYGCPGSTYYNKSNQKQNGKAAKQMKLF